MKTKSKSKILSGLLAMSLAVSAVFVNSTDVMAVGTDINDTNFPNATFQAFVQQYDTTDDDILDAAEIQAVKEMTIDSSTVSDISQINSADGLTGIGYFTSLETLNISASNLTAIDTTGCSALKTLKVQSTNLASINVTGNTALTRLDITSTSLVNTIDVSNNTELTWLVIDAQHRDYNDPSDTAISTLDVSNNAKLETLAVQYTDVTTLDLTNNTALTYLNAKNNLLTSIDVTGLSKLTSLDVNGNRLPNKNAVSGFTGTWDETNFKYGTQKVDADDKIVVELTAANFPDSTFRAWVSQTYDKDGIEGLSAAELANATYVIVSGNEIITTMEFFRGIELLTALDTIAMTNFQPDVGMNEYDFTVFPDLKDRVKVIDISNSNITKLNVSGMTALEMLNLETSSKLEMLNITNCTGLKELDVSGTKLTTLDTSTNTALEKLTLNNTAQLQTIDLSKNTALKTLLMNNTGLKTLDVSGLASLNALTLGDAAIKYLDVSGTALSGTFIMPEAVTYFDMSDTDITSQPNRRSVMLETFIAKNSQLEYLSLNHATKLKHLDVSGSQFITYIDLTNTSPEYVNVSACKIPTKELVEGFDTNKWDEVNFIYDAKSQTPSPYVLEGANLVAKPGEAITLTSNDEFANYDRVEVGGVVVHDAGGTRTPGVDVVNGSIAVTLGAEYLETLTPNTPYVVMIYSDGGSARAVITVSDPTAPNPTDPADPADPTEPGTDVPKTGDASNSMLLFVVMTVSALGVVTVLVARKKLNA